MSSNEDAGSPRARMVQSAARMISERGVTGVGMRQIAADANGPRGSLQRYFPGGKAQVMVEALDVALEEFKAGIVRAHIEATSLPEAIAMVIAPWREMLIRRDYTSGCPIAAVVVDATENPALRNQAEERFRLWRLSIAATYERFGYDHESASAEAVLVISALEGAALIARAARTLEPLDTIERLLVGRARTTR